MQQIFLTTFLVYKWTYTLSLYKLYTRIQAEAQKEWEGRSKGEKDSVMNRVEARKY